MHTELMKRVCEATGLSDRQVFHEARIAFVGMSSDIIRQTANMQYHEYLDSKKMPTYVENWCIDKMVQVSRPRLKAKKKYSLPSQSDVDLLFEADAA